MNFYKRLQTEIDFVNDYVEESERLDCSVVDNQNGIQKFEFSVEQLEIIGQFAGKLMTEHSDAAPANSARNPLYSKIRSLAKRILGR